MIDFRFTGDTVSQEIILYSFHQYIITDNTSVYFRMVGYCQYQLHVDLFYYYWLFWLLSKLHTDIGESVNVHLPSI